MIQSPGELTVVCDECGDEADFDVTEYAGSPPTFGVDESTIEDKGWSTCGDCHFCPKCSDAKCEEE